MPVASLSLYSTFPSPPMSTCPFCRIATAPSGTSTLLQTPLAVAFLDIRPIRPGHVLVVPRRHEPDFWNLTDDERHDIFALAKRIAGAQRQLFNPLKVGLLVAGFDVPHAHVHVVPLHDAHDLTSERILNGSVKSAAADELADLQGRYAQHFLAPR